MADPSRDLSEHAARHLAWFEEHRARYSLLEAADYLARISSRHVDGDSEEGGLRITHAATMGFDAGEVRVDPGEGATEPWTLIAAVFGLCGAATPMPHYLAEEAAVEDEGGAAIRAFLDGFHHRLFAALLAATKTLDVPTALMSDDGAWVRRLIAMAGVDESIPLNDGVVLQILPILFSGDRSRGAIETALKIALAPYVGDARVRIEEFTGAWVPVNVEQQTRLGGMSACLGRTFIAGESIFMPAAAARLVIGPLRRQAHHHFVPGASGHRTLLAIKSLFVSPALSLAAVLEVIGDGQDGAILGQSRLGDDFALPGSDGDGAAQRTINLNLEGV